MSVAAGIVGGVRGLEKIEVYTVTRMRFHQRCSEIATRLIVRGN